MGDIFQEIDEELRRDRAEALWKRYGNVIIGVAGAVVIATAAFVAWQEFEKREAVTATANLHTALSAVRAGQDDTAIAALGEVAKNSGGGAALLASMQEASLRAEKGDRDNARVLYNTVRANASTSLSNLATIRLVELDLADGDTGELLRLLAPLSGNDSPWRFAAWELSAYLHKRAGDLDAAKAATQKILDDGQASAAARARAESFLAQL